MQAFFLFLSILPLLLVNVWHGILLGKSSKDGRPHTISQHAVDSPRALYTHRLIHVSASVMLITLAALYLLPHGYLLAGCLIITGAVFDILQAATLNKKSASEIINFNYHAVTAWSMALCYLLYASMLIPISGLPILLTVMIWVSFTILLIVSLLHRFKDFWITQHIYFCFLALMIIVAHVSLIF